MTQTNFIFIIILVVMIAGAVLTIIKKTRLFGKILLSIGLFLIFASIAVIAGLIVAMMTKEVYGYFVMTAIALIYLLIISLIFRLLRRKPIWITLLSLTVVLIISSSIVIGWNIHIDSIPKLDDRIDLLSQYAPFDENSKVARLDSEPELKLSENLPVLDGATALYPIYSAFANAVYPESAQNHVMCTSTSTAYENIVDGKCDIAFVGAASDKQLQYAKAKGVELEFTPIGYEAFVFFVNSKNPIEKLSSSQIKSIYSGKVTKWSEFGIKGLGKIKAFQREEGSGSQTRFVKFMEGEPIMNAPMNIQDTMAGIIEETADYKNFKNAIGYSFRFYASEMIQNNQIKLLKLDGVYPNKENIENGSYPVTNSFYIVTRKSDTNENTKKFIEWILSEQGTELITKTGYTPITKTVD